MSYIPPTGPKETSPALSHSKEHSPQMLKTAKTIQNTIAPHAAGVHKFGRTPPSGSEHLTKVFRNRITQK